MNIDQIIEEEESLEHVKQIKRAREPKNAYEFCQAFSQYGKMPVGYYLKNTSHWPKDMRWHFELASLLKEKNNIRKAKIINWYVREARAKIKE